MAELDVPVRRLLGAGPSNIDPRVYRAMMTPVMCYMEPQVLRLLEDTQRPLAHIFRTENELTVPLAGSGSLGMEAAVFNVLDPGDVALVCDNGYFGSRLAEMVRRCGAIPVVVRAEWCRVIEPEMVERALRDNPRTKAVAIVQGETSTGVSQPLTDIASLAHQHDALMIVDAASSLGGCELRVDEWGLDVVYASADKCLSAPPGLAPITFSERAMEVARGKRAACASWYADVTLLRNQWSGSGAYAPHHTPPLSLLYAFREALALVLAEELEAGVTRHRRNAGALCAGLEAMGLELAVEERYRLPSLTCVRLPEGIEETAVRNALYSQYSLEVAAGLGPLAGRVLRVGLMGYNSTPENVLAVLNALESVLLATGAHLERGSGVAAACRSLAAFMPASVPAAVSRGH